MSGILSCLVSYPALARQDNGNGPDEIPFEIARLIIEYNATDEDVGVQVLLDGGSYDELNIFGPDGNRLLKIEATSSLQKQGLTELFFESSGSTLDEVPLEDSFWRDSRRENTSSRARELMEFLWQAM
jgi:hypothetical protein